jgi:aryl-alcohol dehydrogenase-like predicted oxidoreductase
VNPAFLLEDTIMRKVKLGHTGEDVSALCLGAMYFGTRNDESSSFRLLDRYAEAGGMFIDTANIYAHWAPGGRGGESESLLGTWMRERQNRNQMFIASKVGFELPGTDRGLRAAQIETECDRSLKRLGVDTIDLYYAHVDDRTTPLEETLIAFQRLVEQGKVRYIGASNYRAWRLEQAHWLSEINGWPEFCCIQQRHTYLRPNHDANFDAQVAVNDDLLDYVKARGKTFTLLAYSALLSGSYTREDRPLPDQYVGADSDSRLAALRSVAAELGVSPNQVILAWMLRGDPLVLPLIAASTEAQLNENLAALDIDLSHEQLARLNHAAG